MVNNVPITEAEIEFMEMYHDPTAMTECLIPDKDAPFHNWPSCNCVVTRDYQFAMQNYSYMFADDPLLEEYDNIKMKKGAGDLYSIGSRNTGKSHYTKIDIILSYIHAIGQACLASFDFKHLNKIASEIADHIEGHKFLKIFFVKDSRQNTVKRKEGIQVVTEHGFQLKSVNEKAGTDEAGIGFWGLHYNTFWYEEGSEMSKEGTEKRVDAGNLLGYIERISGIPNFCSGSPLTKIFNNKKYKNWIWRLPQFVMQSWNNEIQQQRIEEYNGENSAAYKLNVLAEIMEGAFGLIDMDRFQVASCKNVNRKIKQFEVGKDDFNEFDSRIIVERLPGTQLVFIDADVGYGAAPTEIAIHFFDGTKYKYYYNVSLYRLLIKEQAKIFKFLYDQLGGAYISADSTCGNGELIDELAGLGISSEHLLKVKFTENLDVGFEKDNEGKQLFDDQNDPVMKQINTEEWSFKEMERMFYNGEMEIPQDDKLMLQVTNIIAKSSKGKMFYDNKGENHLVQAMQCFFINRFFNEFKTMRNQTQRKRSFGVVNIGEKYGVLGK